MRLVAAIAVIAAVPACGTAIALSYPTDVPFLRAHSDVVVGTRPLDEPEQTTVAQIATGPLRVTCRTTMVAKTVETTMVDTFDGLGRVWCGFMAISEGAFAAGIATSSRTAGGITAGSIIGADALGALLYAIVASSTSHVHTSVGAGAPQSTPACGDDLVVHTGDATWPIARDGAIGGDVKALASVIAAGGAIAVAGNGVEAPWTADASERCAVAAQFAIDVPLCAVPAVAAPAPHAPLEIRIRLKLR